MWIFGKKKELIFKMDFNLKDSKYLLGPLVYSLLYVSNPYIYYPVVSIITVSLTLLMLATVLITGVLLYKRDDLPELFFSSEIMTAIEDLKKLKGKIISFLVISSVTFILFTSCHFKLLLIYLIFIGTVCVFNYFLSKALLH